MKRISVAVCLLVGLATLGVVPRAVAQSYGDLWGEPINLSRTGAASDPQIVAGTDDTLQIFWWDQFDGLTTVILADGVWSEPAAAPLRTAVRVSEEQFVLVPLEVMPTIHADGLGWLHAFWIGETDAQTGMTPLLRSRMPVGDTNWTTSDLLAESAVSFEVAPISGGGLAVAYVRAADTEQFPAGLYVKTTAGGAGVWSPPSAVYQSAYYRMMAQGSAHVRIAAGRDSTVYLGWRDPYMARDLFSSSSDGGATWSAPEGLGTTAHGPSGPRVFALPDGGALRIWGSAGAGPCELVEQRLAAEGGADRQWSDAQPALAGLGACPQGAEGSWARGEALVWVWGQGTSELTFVAWDVAGARWSAPRSVALNVEDREKGRRTALGELCATRVGDQLAMVGSTGGDIWSTQNRVDAIEFAFASATPWLAPISLSEPGVWSGWPAVAVDDAGGVHVVWPTAATSGHAGTSLLYARLPAARGRPSKPVLIVSGSPNEEMVRQPALLVDRRGVMHLVWSGGVEGEILYCWARADQAAESGGWSNPRSLPMPSTIGSWPQIAMRPSGELVVAYVVPLNEARGVYVTRSSDGGETWSAPETVFDAAEKRWAMVDQPSLAASSEGSLHVAWVRAAPPGSWRPQGIYYALWQEGATWTEAAQLASPGFAWPRLTTGAGAVHLAYTSHDAGAWHRHAAEDAADSAAGWSPSAPIRGLDLVEGPLALVSDGSGSIQALAGVRRLESVVHGAWDGEMWAPRPGLSLGSPVGSVLGTAAASRTDAGVLAVVARTASSAMDESAPAILLSVRETEPILEQRVVTSEPTPEMRNQMSPTTEPTQAGVQATVRPSPMPALSTGPEGPTSPYGPLMIGGALAGALVFVLLAAGVIRRGWQR